MLKLYLVLTGILLANTCMSQQKGIYFFDSNWQPVKEKKAVYLIRHKQLPDNTWQTDYYHFNGPLIRTETYTDNKADIRHGRSSWYSRTGHIDSTGSFNNNVRDKSWFFYYPESDSAKISKIVDYDNGRVIKIDDRSQMKETKDTVAADEKESEFVGGQQGWMRYLNKTFRYPESAVKLGSQGTIRIMFVVNTDGVVEDPLIYKSAEISLDDESLRVLNATPAWVPATKNGEKVKTYKIQPFTFRLQTGR
jgi:periplasmic protein TonB